MNYFIRRFATTATTAVPKKLQNVRGMPDLLAAQLGTFNSIQSAFVSITDNFDFQDIETPIVEPAELFTRSLGDSSDVVRKEMYLLDERGSSSSSDSSTGAFKLSLRPEGTAGVVRALIQNGDDRRLPVRWRYSGPFFRYERPQRARARQFHQVGVEMFASKSHPQVKNDTLLLLFFVIKTRQKTIICIAGGR